MFLAREIFELEKCKLDGCPPGFSVPYRFYVGIKTEFLDFIEQKRAFDSLGEDLCHRDYSIVGGATSVAVFDDRVGIWSGGKLPFDIHPGDLKRKHESKPRNPFITDVFFRRGLIEQLGRGTQKIVELYKRAGHPEPEFEEIAGSVVVTFRPALGSITPQVTPQVAPQVTTEVTGEVAGGVTGEVARLLLSCSTPSAGKTYRKNWGCDMRIISEKPI